MTRLSKLARTPNRRSVLLKQLMRNLLQHKVVKTTLTRAKALASFFSRRVNLIRKGRRAIGVSLNLGLRSTIRTYTAQLQDSNIYPVKVKKLPRRMSDSARLAQVSLLN